MEPLLKSKLEKNIWKGLKSLKRKHKFTLGYESKALLYSLPKRYIPDFVLQFKDGRLLFIETKGYLRPEDRTKMVAVKKSNPSADIRIIFAVDNKISKQSKTRYSDWAKKHGFPYAFNTIPKEWFECPQFT